MIKKILIMLIIVLSLFACKKKADNQDVSVYTDARFFPVPEFVDLFASLDYVEQGNFDRVIPDYYVSDITNSYEAAFYLGTLTANAVVSAKARNKDKLTTIALCMIDYSKMLGISHEVLRLADELLTLLQEDNWDELLFALDDYKVLVEMSLYDSRQFDLMTLVQAGGWLEGIRLMTSLLLLDYRVDNTTILNQKGIVDNLVNNLSQMENEDLYELQWFQNIITAYQTIYEIVNVQGKNTFSIEEIIILNSLR